MIANLSSFVIIEINDLFILIADQGGNRSVTDDAPKVVERLESYCKRIGTRKKGIGRRKVYYRDANGYFDEILVEHGAFAGFEPCSPQQQYWFPTRMD